MISPHQVISMLPQCHQNVFNYVAAFLRELLKNSASNRLDVNILGKKGSSLLFNYIYNLFVCLPVYKVMESIHGINFCL